MAAGTVMGAQKSPAQQAIGKSQAAFAEEAEAKREELAESGQSEVFTVVNFNPSVLRLSGELSAYSVASPLDERLPKGSHGMRVEFEYDSRVRVGHCLTIRSPKIFGKNSNVTTNGHPSEAIPERALRWFTPAAIAYAFLEHYSPIFVRDTRGIAAPPPSDGRRMYGVLAFRGDIHTLEKVMVDHDGDERPNWQNATIDVPYAKVIRGNQRLYQWLPYRIGDYLKEMFDGQLRYAAVQVRTAQSKANQGEKGMGDIGNAERMWLNFLIGLGYIDPKTDAACTGTHAWWNEMSTLITASGADARGKMRKCPACRTPESEPDTPFCPKCHEPMDVFKTFMAGHVVSEAHLRTLRGNELEEALEEWHRRQDLFTVGSRPRGNYKQGPARPAAAPKDVSEKDIADPIEALLSDNTPPSDGSIPGEGEYVAPGTVLIEGPDEPEAGAGQKDDHGVESKDPKPKGTRRRG